MRDGSLWPHHFCVRAKSAPLPKAVVVQQIPGNLKNGERPWAELAESEVEKIRAALPDKAQVAPAKPRKLLVFYRTDGFPHASIPHWNKCIELLGQKTGAFTVTLSQSYDDLTAEKLKDFDALFFNNTCRMKTPEPVKAALMDFVKSGKGFAGNHGAGDNWHDWPEGKEMLGCKFVTHPFGRIQIKVDDAQSPLTAAFGGQAFPYQDEIYAFTEPYNREKLRVLLSIDYPNSPEVAKAEQTMLKRAAEPNARQFDKDSLAAVRADKDYALAWIRPWGKGRFFYCALGHRAEVTFDTAMVKFYLAGIQYALGDLQADEKPTGPAPAPAAPVKTGAAPAQNPADSEQAKIVLQHVRFDPAFEFTTFAAPPMVNSPVFVSAAPDGCVESPPVHGGLGRQYIAAHSVRQSGATFVESAAPVNLAMLKPELKPGEIRNNAFRPSDVDVDARGYLYLASWVNGGFGAGDKCGVIFKMHPKGHIALKLPDFTAVTTVELANLMTSPSHRTRLEAQRVLLRRGADDAALRALEKIAGDKSAQLESRVAALFTLRQAGGEKTFPFLAQLASDSSIAAWAIRALADDERLAARVPVEPLLAGLKSFDARTRREAVFAIARLGQPKLGTSITPLLDDSDEVVAHTAFRALAKLRASEACFAVLDYKSASPAKRTGAIRAVQTLHEAGVVEGLIARVAKENDAPRRRDLLSALCRLYNTEGEWAGDSWGTRPDDRGPYYQPEPWSESQKISDAILKTMSTLDSADATWLGNELAHNRVNLKDATRQLLALAEKDPSVLPPLFRNLADGDDIPLPAIPLLIRSAFAKETDPKLRTDAIVALSKTDSREAFAALIEGMTQKCDDGIHRARKAYHAAPHRGGGRDAARQPRRGARRH